MTILNPKDGRKAKRIVKFIGNPSLASAEEFDVLDDKIEALADKLDGVTRAATQGLEHLSKELEKDMTVEVVMKKLQGIPGKTGPQGEPGKDYVLTEADKNAIAAKIKVPIVEKITERVEVIKEQPIVTEVVREVAMYEKPEAIRDKLHSLKEEARLDMGFIKGLTEGDGFVARVLKAVLESVPIRTLQHQVSFLVNRVGDLTTRIDRLPTTSSGGGHVIQDEGTPLTQRAALNFVGAGVTVTDDAGNDATKITISGGSGGSFQQPLTGAVDGENTVFTWATEPNVIVVDSGRIIQKVSSDTTENWTGTTTTTLLIAPNSDIFAVA